MSLPTITHLQYLILDGLASGGATGQEVRESLKRHKIKKDGPGFYQLMARLEDAGFVKGTYKNKVVDGQPIKERFYSITASGTRSYEQTRDFYLSLTGEMAHA